MALLMRGSAARLALMGFSINPILWGSFYPVTKDVLATVDHNIVIGLAMVSYVFTGLIILAGSGRIFSKVLVSGAVLALPLAAAYLTSVIALNLTTATNTGVLPALTGVIAILLGKLVFAITVGRGIWLAGIVSIVGVALLVAESPKAGGSWVGDGIALASTCFYTLYIFACAKLAGNDTRTRRGVAASQAIVLGMIGITVAAFGDWGRPPITPHEIGIVAYIGIATLVIPTLISVFLIRFVVPLAVSFIYILEPIWAAVFSFIYLGETLTTLGYIGGAFIVAGSVITVAVWARQSAGSP